MRHRRVETTAGVVDAHPLDARRLLTRVGIAALVLWIVVAFAQEAWTANRLSAQAADLRQRNAALQAQNAEYRRDITTVQSGAAAEEVARSNGYSRPDEHVYVVASPTPRASPPAPRVHVQQSSPSLGEALREWFFGIVRPRR